MRFRLRLTRHGFRLVFLSVGILVAALNTSNNLLLVLFSLLVGLLVASPLLAAWNLRGVRVMRVLPDRAIVGRDFPVIYRFHPRGWWARSLLHVKEEAEGLTFGGRLMAASPGEITPLRTTWHADQRGLLKLREFGLTTTYPFNLFSLCWTVRSPATLRVVPSFRFLSLPASGPAGESASLFGLPASKAGHGEEFYGVREIHPGETPRRVHWRCTARQGRLMVVKEEEMKGGPVGVCLNTVGEIPGPSFEALVRTAAAACFSILSKGGAVTALWARPGGWFMAESAEGLVGLNRILDALAEVEPMEAEDRMALPAEAPKLMEWLFVGLSRDALPTELRGKRCVLLRP